MMTRVLILFAALIATTVPSADAFVPPSAISTSRASPNFVFGGGKKKKELEDLSYIETRDLTREEMLEINARNEEVMNMELSMMTGFSLVISLPILYLCWVAFFSD